MYEIILYYKILIYIFLLNFIYVVNLHQDTGDILLEWH